MQPRTLLIGTYGCGRCHQPAGAGGQHENFPQPRVVGRGARSGPRPLGHGCRARRRDRPPQCREAARRQRVCPAAVRAHSRADTLTVIRANTITSTNARAVAITSTNARTVAGIHGLALSGTVAGARTETVAQPDADPSVFTGTRPLA